LAVQRVLDGLECTEVAEFLGVDVTSVRRWVRAFRRRGWSGLTAEPPAGRPGKLSRTQEKIVLRWLSDSATDFGFTTELWTAARIGELIRQEWGVDFNPRYLPRWLKARGFSCQKPERVPRERDDEAISMWIAGDWERIKKKRGASTHA
jgi:transposase